MGVEKRKKSDEEREGVLGGESVRKRPPRIGILRAPVVLLLEQNRDSCDPTLARYGRRLLEDQGAGTCVPVDKRT